MGCCKSNEEAKKLRIRELAQDLFSVRVFKEYLDADFEDLNLALLADDALQVALLTVKEIEKAEAKNLAKYLACQPTKEQ
jgi:hypothetical protein